MALLYWFHKSLTPDQQPLHFRAMPIGEESYENKISAAAFRELAHFAGGL